MHMYCGMNHKTILNQALSLKRMLLNHHALISFREGEVKGRRLVDLITRIAGYQTSLHANILTQQNSKSRGTILLQPPYT